MHVQGEEAIASNVLPYRPSFQTQNMVNSSFWTANETININSTS